ncbi:unnamed protein product [Macrosiphum euphorbiae]|uniref:Uncharacterized protein n=1 Tax=Macrosiphum euphorbiae TaxID=13131 RepID=A0AAV0VZ87_9HEMI|nr:unnamed protein product [Macrosiphum euphorbiae]
MAGANHEVVKTINMHSHEPSAAQEAEDKIVTKIKKSTIETQELTCQVINECTQNSDVACQGALPNQQALKKLIRRKRNEEKSSSVESYNSGFPRNS